MRFAVWFKLRALQFFEKQCAHGAGFGGEMKIVIIEMAVADSCSLPTGDGQGWYLVRNGLRRNPKTEGADVHDNAAPVVRYFVCFWLQWYQGYWLSTKMVLNMSDVLTCASHGSDTARGKIQSK